MSAWVAIKAGARRVRRAAEEQAGPSSSLDLVLATALATAGVEVEFVSPDDPLLGGGEARLDRESDDGPVVWVRSDATPAWRRFLLAHELAHALLHAGSFVCGSGMVDPAQGEEDVPAGAGGYSARDRLERQANVWGREFLLPAPALRGAWVPGVTRAEVLADELGLDERLIRRQAARALLTVEPPLPGPPDPPPTLQGAQKRAAEAKRGPLLVVAGPGTGKTTTLAARVAWLLDQSVEPEAITAVTFSRRAAEEMRQRIAAARPDHAERLRLDTLHSLALDILRRRGPWPDAEVVDEARAAGLVERLVPTLGLRHLLYLPDPAARVRDALRGVRRAKDEGVGPERFTQMARAELDDALAAWDEEHARPRSRRTERDRLDARVRRAERVEETARVYRAYQAQLRSLRRYDFGDLLTETIKLFKANPAIRDAEGGEHLLVDEVQDLNGTALALVRLLAGDGAGFWAVGDPHQAIYRFQGASAEGFGALTKSCRPEHLDQNRRSRREVVDVFQSFVPRMAAAPDPGARWEAERGAGGTVAFRTAESPEAELAGLTRAVQALAATIPHREQAVIARKHAHLADVAEALEAAGIPVLFLSGLFERPTVRDLLAVLELASEPSGRALVRVAGFPEYAVPREDTLALLRHAAAQDQRFPSALALAEEAPGLSDAGRRGLARLRSHVERVGYADHPWVALTDYLFNASAYLDRLVAGIQPDSPEDQRRRAAVFQLLQVAASYAPPRSASDPKRTFLAYVRRLAASTEHRQLAQPPEWAAPIDAVRLLTVHAAKGLEFSAVHVPFLNEFDFHLWSGGERPLAPTAVLGDDDGHHAEEECVHFVAASRARDVLSLSRSLTRRNAHGELRPAKPTPLLRRAPNAVPGRLNGTPEWPGAPAEVPPPDRTPLDDPPLVEVADLEAYAECPRRYAYERREGLAGHTETTPYRRLVRIVRGLLRGATEAHRRGEAPDEDGAVERWRTEWAAESDDSDPYHELFLHEGEERVRRAFAHLDHEAEPLDVELVWRRPKGSVVARADLVLREASGRVRVQRWVAGAPNFYEKRRLTYAVLHGAAAEQWGRRARVEAVAVAAKQVESVDRPPGGAEAVDRALDGLHRGDFPARPDPYRCPSCPFYFLCPS